MKARLSRPEHKLRHCGAFIASTTRILTHLMPVMTEQPDHSVSLGDSFTSSTRIRFSVHNGAAIQQSRPFRRDAIRKRWRLRQQRCLEVASRPAMLAQSMGRVGLIDVTVGNAARLGASQRSTTRRCASHHIAPRPSNPVLSEAANGFVDDEGQVRWIVPRGRISLPG
jgi:hypothetical protein